MNFAHAAPASLRASSSPRTTITWPYPRLSPFDYVAGTPTDPTQEFFNIQIAKKAANPISLHESRLATHPKRIIMNAYCAFTLEIDYLAGLVEQAAEFNVVERSARVAVPESHADIALAYNLAIADNARRFAIQVPIGPHNLTRNMMRTSVRFRQTVGTARTTRNYGIKRYAIKHLPQKSHIGKCPRTNNSKLHPSHQALPITS